MFKLFLIYRAMEGYHHLHDIRNKKKPKWIIPKVSGLNYDIHNKFFFACIITHYIKFICR